MRRAALNKLRRQVRRQLCHAAVTTLIETLGPEQAKEVAQAALTKREAAQKDRSEKLQFLTDDKAQQQVQHSAAMQDAKRNQAALLRRMLRRNRDPKKPPKISEGQRKFLRCLWRLTKDEKDDNKRIRTIVQMMDAKEYAQSDEPIDLLRGAIDAAAVLLAMKGLILRAEPVDENHVHAYGIPKESVAVVKALVKPQSQPRAA